MSKRKNFKNVKNLINSIHGYKLLSTEYKNALQKLEIQCPKNHIFQMSYSCFRIGQRCPICQKINSAIKRKFNYNYVKRYIKLFGYKLLSNEYKGALKKIDIKCPIGHIYKVKFNNFQQGQRCPECLKKIFFSKKEKEILKYVKSVYNGLVLENDRKQIINPLTNRFLELDIWLPELNKAIEYNGEYWHTEENVKYRDNQKQIQCKEKGIELLVIEEKNGLKIKFLKM